MSENIEMPKFPGIPSLAELYAHSREIVERLVCDESTLSEHRTRLRKLTEKVNLIEGDMWATVCQRNDPLGKPLYTNEKQRQYAFEMLRAESLTDSALEKYKEYIEINEEGEALYTQIDLLASSIEALRRTFSLNVAVIRAMSGYFT